MFVLLSLIIGLISANLVGAETQDKWQKNIQAEAFDLKEEGRSALNEGDIEEAIIKFQSAINLKTDYYVGSFYLGISHQRNKDLKKATFWFEKAADIARANNIKDPSVYNTLGSAYLTQGELKKAESVFEEGLQIAPKNPNLLNNYGILMFQVGNYDESIIKLQEASDGGFGKAKQSLEKVKSIQMQSQ